MVLLPTYERRQPEHTALWHCVRAHLSAFLSQAEAVERPVPQFIREEFERFLRCGILSEGCAKVRCEQCGFTRLVAFSCKGRGVCPSCIARRMSDTAAHLLDHVWPEVPTRQWVLSLPVPLRYLLAWDCELSSAVIGLFIDTVFGHLRQVAKRELGLCRLEDALPGAVCVVQRWGGSVNLNPHLHTLVMDGVFVRGSDGVLVFRALPEPTKAELAAVAWRICERVVALLRKRGQWLDAPPENDPLADVEPLLAALYTGSITGTLVMGAKAGQRQMRLYGAPAREPEEGGKVRNAYGFDLHAGARIAAHDRKRLEMLARYTLRPPLSHSRLEELPDGRYQIALKKAWSDGTTHLVLDGVELLGRLAALVPPPRAHLTRYYGVFAPRSKVRAEVVPKPEVESCAHAPTDKPEKQRRNTWSELLARVFAIDVLECPRCHSRMQRVEWSTRPEKIALWLKSTGPPTTDAQVA